MLRRLPGRMAAPAVLLTAGLAIVACDRTPPASGPTTGPASGPTSGAPLPVGFVVLTDVDPTILADIRYAGAHNFIGRPIAGYQQPLCLLTRQAADALRRVQAAVGAQGKSLKVYDCYRPQQAVADIVRWAENPGDQQMKAEFYPRVAKTDLITDGYIGSPTAHSRGSTVDLTLVDLPARSQPPYVPGDRLASCVAPPAQRFADNSVDMGTGFDCFDPRATTASPEVVGAARDNRQVLTRSMAAGGFVNYLKEWWHYRLEDEPYPETYFNFPVGR